MEKQTNIKYLVKEFLIDKPFQKIRFQIRHPENVCCLTGIAVTMNLFFNQAPKVVGALTLFIPEKGDIFYAEELKKNILSFPEMQGVSSIFPVLPDIFRSRKQPDYFDTNVPVTGAMIEGFYDSLYDGGTESRVPLAPRGYSMKIYLRYERSNPNENDSRICT